MKGSVFGGGGIAVHDPEVLCTVVDCLVARCTATAPDKRVQGGGIGVFSGAELTCGATVIEQCVVSSPHSSSGGGGLAVSNGRAKLTNSSTIRGCFAHVGAVEGGDTLLLDSGGTLAFVFPAGPGQWLPFSVCLAYREACPLGAPPACLKVREACSRLPDVETTSGATEPPTVEYEGVDVVCQPRAFVQGWCVPVLCQPQHGPTRFGPTLLVATFAFAAFLQRLADRPGFNW